MSQAHREGRIQDGHKPDDLLRERRSSSFRTIKAMVGYKEESQATRGSYSQLSTSVGPESGVNQPQAKILGKVRLSTALG